MAPIDIKLSQPSQLKVPREQRGTLPRLFLKLLINILSKQNKNIPSDHVLYFDHRLEEGATFYEFTILGSVRLLSEWVSSVIWETCTNTFIIRLTTLASLWA